jgi:hypothetical protein
VYFKTRYANNINIERYHLEGGSIMGEHDTLNVYTDLHHGSKMGVEAIDTLIKKTENEDFKQELLEMQNEYKDVSSKADMRIQKLGGVPHELGPFTKMSTWISSSVSTITDKSNAHLAEMMIKGNHMGIKETEDSIRNNPHADNDARSMSEKFIRLQQEHISKMEQYIQ